jgi:hypothetical protein
MRLSSRLSSLQSTYLWLVTRNVVVIFILFYYLVNVCKGILHV